MSERADRVEEDEIVRIISDDAIWSFNDYIKKWDTIEITDDDMDKIKLEYDNYIGRQLKWIGQDLSEGKITENEMFDKFSSLPKFSQYLKDLIVLDRMHKEKGK